MRKYRSLVLFLIVMLLVVGCEKEAQPQVASVEKVVAEKTSATVPATNIQGSVETTTTPSPYANQILTDDRTGVEPVAIEIPAIDVKASVIGVGRLEDGEMDVPNDGHTTGWYNLGYKPGEPGNAAIAGHVSSHKGPAIFFNLKKLKRGDEVIIIGKNKEKLVFEVIEVTSYPRLKAPLNKIFGYTSRSALNLITCSGKYDSVTTQNSERLVVYTQLKK